jgi:hypothetical protein
MTVQLKEIKEKVEMKSKLLNIFKGNNEGKLFKNKVVVREHTLLNNKTSVVNHLAKHIDIVIYDHLLENQPVINCGERLTKKHINKAKRQLELQDEELILITDFIGADDLKNIDIGMDIVVTKGAVSNSAILTSKKSISIEPLEGTYDYTALSFLMKIDVVNNKSIVLDFIN